MSLTFLHVETKTHKYFKDFVEIYTQAFDEDEQESIEVIKQRIQEKRYSLVLALKDETILGFYILDIVKKYKFVILTFLAVAENFRANGYGKELCNDAISFVLNLKNIDLFLTEAKELQSVFYKRLGFKKLNLDYNIPNFDDENSAETNLMIFPLDEEKSVKKEYLKKIIQDIFMDGYQVKEDDIRLKNQLEKINKNIEWIS